jgi:hypothetical protein
LPTIYFVCFLACYIDHRVRGPFPDDWTGFSAQFSESLKGTEGGTGIVLFPPITVSVGYEPYSFLFCQLITEVDRTTALLNMSVHTVRQCSGMKRALSRLITGTSKGLFTIFAAKVEKYS